METALLQARRTQGKSYSARFSGVQAGERRQTEDERRVWTDRQFPRLPVMSQFITWFSQPEAAAKLHVSERTLIRWRSSKFLKQGKHWRRALPSPRARVLYNIEQCEKDVVKACSRDGAFLEQEIKFIS